MSEQGKTTGTARNQVIILTIIGIIVFIAGICIATIHSPLRGSGLGTVFYHNRYYFSSHRQYQVSQ